MRKILLTILILLLVAGLALTAFGCKTGALWRTQTNDTRGNQADVSKTNPTEKYIVYAALNSAGNLIARPAEGEPEATAAYAVVGYTGLIPDLVIPAQYAGKNVTKVLVAAPSYANYYCFRNVDANGDPIPYTLQDARFTNDELALLLNSIEFGSNVAFVGAGVCGGLINLTAVSFKNPSAVTLAASAFVSCVSLTSVSFACASGSVTLNGNFAGLTPTYAS